MAKINQDKDDDFFLSNWCDPFLIQLIPTWCWGQPVLHLFGHIGPLDLQGHGQVALLLILAMDLGIQV